MNLPKKKKEIFVPFICTKTHDGSHPISIFAIFTKRFNFYG